MDRPLGPLVDPTPRPLPARVPLRGQHVVLEPLHGRHAAELWEAAQGPEGERSWDYVAFGPFPSQDTMAAYVADSASVHDPMTWAARPVSTGAVSGLLSLMEIQPGHASVELGLWLAPRMQRTRAGTEAILLLLRLMADDLGYRRLAWTCNALNAPSRRAAQRLGFTYEGTLRAQGVVKGRLLDRACFSIIGDEWPACRNAMLAWLDPANAAPDGTARRGLAEIRAGLARG